MLAKKLEGRAIIHLITTQPNRYHTYKEESLAHEIKENLIIDRISIAKHRNGFLDQINSFRTYYRSVRALTRNEKYDLIFCSSSRLFSSYLAKKLAVKNSCQLYLDVRDLFVDNMKEVIKNPFLKYPLNLILKSIEKTTFSYASHINLVSKGFVSNFEKYKKANYTYYPNGIDEVFINLNQDAKNLNQHYKVITYAGNIGEGQGLDKIVPYVAEKLSNTHKFIIIGDGSSRASLELIIKQKKLRNVELLYPVRREELVQYYKRSHFLFLHLNDFDAFKKVLPSKIFEYGATNIPIIAGVSGYSRSFMEENISNCLIFDPCDIERMTQMLLDSVYYTNERLNFVKRFNRNIISQKLTDSIISYLG
ncbi:MAG: glycosyltransferase family 4 protein [Chitinophagaceae bacterium]